MTNAQATLKSIHRYAVKSMLGETLETVLLGERGIPGDRAWAVRDEERGGIRGGKKIPGLMNLAAHYESEPTPGEVPPPRITLPDGSSFTASEEDAAERVSAAIERDITLWPLLPAEALDHYRRGEPDDPDLLNELRSIFGRTEDEPLPDIGKFPPELMEFESPPGTYFDAFPLLLMTTRSLETLAARAPDCEIDVRRFRPNLLIDTEDSSDWPEIAWQGQALRIGEAVLQVEVDCPRCVMTTHGFADLPRDPAIMRKLVQEAGGSLGVYATIREPGVVRTGDSLEFA